MRSSRLFLRPQVCHVQWQPNSHKGLKSWWTPWETATEASLQILPQFPRSLCTTSETGTQGSGKLFLPSAKNRKELLGDTHSRLNKLIWSTKKSNFYVATVKWASAGFFLRPQQARSKSSPYHTPCRCTDPIFKIALQKGRQAVPGSINQAHPAGAAAAAAGVGGVFHSYDSADQYGAVQSQHCNSAFFTTKGKKVTKKRSNLASSPSSGPQTSQPEQSIHSGHGSTSVCPENVWLDFRILMCFWTETGRDH